MLGQRLGYVRVSTLDQNPDRQLENIPVDRTFTEHASGKDTPVRNSTRCCASRAISMTYATLCAHSPRAGYASRSLRSN